jgi:cell pole-organizing protein PopZ
MSDAKGQQNEPSMEEILASIRRIIAEDGDAPAPAAATPAAAGAAPASAPAASATSASHAPDDILELTDVVGADGTVVNLNAAKAAPEPPRQAPPPPEPRQYVEFEPAAPQDERIVSPHTAAAAVGAFSQLSALRDDARTRDIGLGAGHLTLETIVREELRPILRAWLDANLPNMVERLVQQEISRLVSDVQRR